MKKFALGILSVFLILGGVLLSACDKKVSLSVSDSEVVLYTNYEQGVNKSKEIEVDLKNSSAGVNVEVVYGLNCIDLELSNTTKKKANGMYAFKILTKEDKSSGLAQVKVSSVEDSSQFEYVNITVNTVIEEFKMASEDSESGKSNLFVVKGVEKQLVTTDYFEVLPISANICDVAWSFEDGGKEFAVDNQIVATIQGNLLQVSENYSFSNLTVVASYTLNSNISRSVTLEVLENSTISSYIVEDKVFYRAGKVETTQATVALKRNDSTLSTAQGTLTLAASEENELRLSPIVYRNVNGKSVLVGSEEYEKYFIFDYSERSSVGQASTVIYDFYIDAIDNSAKYIFDQFEFYLRIDYAGFNYYISTDGANTPAATKLVLDIKYAATAVELYNENYSINNTYQDVFSSYENTLGYQVTTEICPKEVAVDDRYYKITLDTNQEALRNLTLSLTNPVADIACFYDSNGELLEFVQSAEGSNIYETKALLAGTKVYIAGGNIYDVLDGVEFKFASRTYTDVNTSLYLTFYKIAEDKNLVVKDEAGEEIADLTYISSSVYSSRKLDVTVKISGISTTSGLQLCSDGVNGFNYSDLTLVSKSQENEDESWIVVTFSMNLTAYNFADTSTFWFEHITGKRSSDFKIEAFVPIESLVVQNYDKASANVYIDNVASQNYILENDIVEKDATRQSSSLSKLMVEAGTALPLYTSVQNATLTEEGITYRYLSYQKLKVYLSILYGITDADELENLANEIFAGDSLDLVADAYMHFDDISTVSTFTISRDMLNLTNLASKGYVAVLAQGYNEEHQTVTIVRFFALESFYSVRFLSSNVKTTLLYTSETLSQSDMNRSFVDVTLSMRQDENVPTYANSLEYFEFTSGIQGFYSVSESRDLWKNDYYSVSNVEISDGGKNLTFRITANSTNLQTSVNDVLKVIYLDEHGFEKIAEIQIEIKNVKRLESVQWVNRTVDNEIYLNLTTTVESEKNFTISTSVEPSDANNTGLTSVYVATSGSSSDIKISTSSIGQIFNVNINTTKGGRGHIYLLPNDMVKNVDGFNQILLYKYAEDADGNTVEVPVYVPLSSLNAKYDEIINGSDEISNYFLNNDGEKIYYTSIILKIAITIADGNSEGTAIRVYNQGDLEQIDHAKYYKVMNDITLTGWEAYDQFSGMIYGNNSNVTLKFTEGSQNFVNNLAGTIKDLTFVGEATITGSANAGFIANVVEKTGTIENCIVDVYYENSQNSYYGSQLKSADASYSGVVAGANEGTIQGVKVFGASLVAGLNDYAGGLVGVNNGLIENCGFEFYKFEGENETEVPNSISTSGKYGGLVGLAGSTSVVNYSYVYAYALSTSAENNNYSHESIIKAEGFVGVFAGEGVNGARFAQTFGFIGDVADAFSTSDLQQYVTVENSYISYYDGVSVCSNIYKLASFSYADSTADYQSDGWVKLSGPNDDTAYSNLNLDSDVWNLEKTDSGINFGYIYLQNVMQSTAVEINDISINNYKGEFDSRYRVLDAGSKTVDEKEYGSGVLFIFNPIATVTDAYEKEMLANLNTISISSLFGISQEQARSVLLTSDSKNISLSANSIKLLNTSSSEFEVNVHSKMDFTQVKSFKFIILNVLPELSTMIDGVSLKDNQVVLVQTGNGRTIVYSTISSLYLGGTTAYALNKDDFTIVSSASDEFVGVARSSNSIVLSGLKNHENNNRTTVTTNLAHNFLSANESLSNYAEVVNDKISRTFDVKVYNGANVLEIVNANNLVVRPSEYASFDVYMQTDEESDDLVFSLNYDNVQISASISDSVYRFDVDSNLSLEVSWAKTESEGQERRYKVLVKVSEDKKHLVSSEYSNLTLSVNALSQQSNATILKTISLKVETQKIEDFSISTYSVERRQIRNSILYLTPSSQIINTLAPASDAIVSVSVTPQYAMMTHFTLTYEVSGTSVGTVGISKLAYSQLYGYYINFSSSTVITNGIRVNITDADKTGDGIYYFRLYISSSFASTSGLKLVVTYYNGNDVLATGSQTLTVNYLQDAIVRVNDASTYLLAKGESATVTIRVGIDQELADLYLQNNESNISITSPSKPTIDGNYKVYTATIVAGVDAKLVGDKTSGIFYVCASVKRFLNNSEEIKVSRATLCLVDFSIETKGISVAGSGNQRTYNGKSYDVFNAYINDNSELYFNYPILPAEYNYDKNNADEVQAVKSLTEKRNDFLKNNYYYDPEVGYYINYVFDQETGRYNPITLKQQLWYATDESYSTAIYNENRGTISSNDYFTLTEESLIGGNSRIMVSGKRAGTQLMKLRTIVEYQGIEIVYDYYFLIVVEVWSDEETPTQITTAEEFLYYATNSESAGDYILMNDIVLSDYTPVDTSLFNSLDGNGFTIHINSFKLGSESSLSLALFSTVTENTTLRNVRVNIYNGGQISVNIKQYSDVQIAGFATANEGIIYNCEVVSYYDAQYQISKNAGNSGLVVQYTNGANSSPIALTGSMGIESKISGFVIDNNASIMNSRVGGASFKHIVDIEGVNYLQTQELEVFHLEGQGEVSGFVNSNSGYVSACFVKDIQIDNIMEYASSITAGFVVTNNQSIQNSYVEGLGGATIVDESDEETPVVYNNLTNISALGVISGFVYENNNLVKNSYSNIAIENTKTKGAMVAGFVYINNSDAVVTLCYSACEIAKQDVTQMQFSGVDDFENSLNSGTISLSYFYNDSRVDDTMQSKVSTSAISLFDVDQKNSFYGFSFASAEGAYNGIWDMTDEGLTLVSANQIAVSNRYATTNGRVTSIFYSRSIRDADTLEYVDLSYGSPANPIVLRDATDFAKAMGKATTTEVSSYKEYYKDYGTSGEVTGYYRIVNNIQMTDIAQDAEDEGSVKLTTTYKVFKGLLDGNGFTISDISLGSSEALENFGLFARLSGAVIMNLDITVESVHNVQANIVGVLAGTAVNSRILSINLSPSQSNNEGESTAVQGRNIVGGVVGMLFGESYLSDITISNVDISSEAYKEGKEIHDNDKYINGSEDEQIKSLRELADELDSGAVLNDKSGGRSTGNIEELSYAGAIAGFVDIYGSQNETYVTYSTSREVGDYDIVTVKVLDSVNIYAEVAGGLFGYVGKSTLIYDASLTINQGANISTQSSTPSYIISKNLFAGGLVGENYGGLFAVSTSYEATLQDTIEKNEHKYYTQSTDVERGQQSIFSYTPEDEGYTTRTNKPRFIGGLVGYMGGGYIYVGYSKLNVIAYEHSGNVVVGGVVGLSGVSSNKYDLTFTTEKKTINILYYEVYASGDAYSEGGYSAGIIGALESKANSTGIVAMKNVMATNYYSYLGNALTADKESASEEEKSYTSDGHFMLVGKIYDSVSGDNVEKLASDFFFIKSTNDIALNLKDGTEPAVKTGSYTVGGYKDILIGDYTATLNEFGFKTQASSSQLTSTIISAQHIGHSDLETPSSAYARMKNYFISNGWNEKYWSHQQDALFPVIELLPRVNILFWDVKNTDEVLASMNDSSATIVVRGRVTDDENDLSRTDIDLRDKKYADVTVKNFRGRLVSYATYMNSEDGGVVTQPIDATKELPGGDVGDKVGIILGRSLFKSLSGNATIEGLTFYMDKPTGGDTSGDTTQDTDSSTSSTVGYSLVDEETETAIFRNIAVRVNCDFTLTVKTAHKHNDSSGSYYAIGLITGLATSTSFYNVDIIFKGESSLTFSSDSDAASDSDVYMGVLAGRIKQASTFSQMTVSGINISKVNPSSIDKGVAVSADPTKIYFNAPSSDTGETDVYAGIYAGEISKTGTAKITLGLRQINSVDLIISGTKGKFYVGGYCGNISGVDDIGLVSGKSDSQDGSGISIRQADTIKELYAGLAFGESNSTVSLDFSDAPNAWLIGRILQKEGVEATVANIGGIVGRSTGTGTIKLSGLRLKFDVAAEGLYDDVYAADDIADDNDNGVEVGDKKYDAYVSEFGENKYEYSLGDLTFNTSAIEEASASTVTYSSIGGVVGYSVGAITLTGACNISGNTIVKSSASDKSPLSVGGVIGKVSDNTVTIGGTITDSVNIYVKDTKKAYVGGIVGDANYSLTDEVSFEIGATGSFAYNGTAIADLGGTGTASRDFIFGGAIAQMKVSTNAKVSISNFTFGGAVKTLAVQSEKVTIGGVVGCFDSDTTTDSNQTASAQVEQEKTLSIEKSLAYGDAFMIYEEYREEKFVNDILSSYCFGGIVGKGPSAKLLKISDCISLMTNFNSKTSAADEDRPTSSDSIGAIVGTNASAVEFAGNKYSSGVTMTYQEQDGNTDYGYGAGTFQGYTNKVIITDADTQELSAGNILEEVKGIGNIETGNYSTGHKLNPYRITVENRNDKIENVTQEIFGGSFNGINWAAVTGEWTEEYSISDSFCDNLVNIAIVGNGRTVTREFNDDVDASSDSSNADNASSDSLKGGTMQNSAIYGGGIADIMGKSYDSNPNASNSPNFNMISSLIVNLDLSANLKNKDYNNAYGGVVGFATGNSFVYGVGVKGDLYVGGEAGTRLAGIVGELESGKIEQCYEDADITYGGLTNGVVSGIANLTKYNSTIKATYSSGKITSYVDAVIYTFAYVTEREDNNKNCVSKIMDSYSITQVERNNVLESKTDFTAGIFFIGNGRNVLTASIMTQVFNGSAEVYQDASYGEAYEEKVKYFESDLLALSYDNADRFGINSIKIKEETKNGNETTINYIASIKGSEIWESVGTNTTKQLTNAIFDDAESGGENTWYFSRLTNYGYASHGFGYLKNSTTYVLESATSDSSGTSSTENDETTEQTSTVSTYKIVDYSELVKGDNFKSTDGNAWYLGVPSVGKFDQMIDTVKTNNSNYNKDYKFVLRYGFNLKDSSKKVSNTTGNTTTLSWSGASIGNTNFNFELDGGENTINLDGVTMTSGLFNEVIGTIKNLRIINGSMKINSSDNTYYGLLANGVKLGGLENITVIGDIENEYGGKYIGGIVGILHYSDATRLESLVNITSSNYSILGGVIGHFNPNPNPNSNTVSYASSTGILINKGGEIYDSNGKEIYRDTYSVTPMKFSNSQEPTFSGSQNLNAITGGIVGYMASGTVKNSYNANSVLSNFGAGETDAEGKPVDDGRNVVSGGIVGYAANGTISNCYNTSLVGAGNYGNASGYSYAGGIVGYATEIYMSGCINDGPVQALGSEDGDYEITVEKLSGSLETKENGALSYSSEPNELIFKLTMTYNPDDYRLVNAFGLGFAEDGKINSDEYKDNYTSTNNVKNDGNVGEISVVSYMVFDRNTMLDDDGKKHYEAAFENHINEGVGNTTGLVVDSDNINKDNSGLYISGYDSYGMPARVYATETITRRLSVNHPFYSMIKGLVTTDTMSTEGEIGGGKNYWYSHYGTITVNDDYSLSYSEDKDSATNRHKGDYETGSFSEDEYKMTSSTDYYASSILGRWWGDGTGTKNNICFDGYDGALQRLNNYGYICGTNIPSDTSTIQSSSSSDINNKIANIDSKIENDDLEDGLQFLNVGGKTIGVAKTSSHITTILTPYTATLDKIEFKVTDSEGIINWGNISDKSVEFKCEAAVVQKVDYAVDVNKSKGTITVTSKDETSGPVLYFSKKINNASISVSLSYESKSQKFSITSNNSSFSDNTLIIDLSEIGNTEFLEKLTEGTVEINSASINGKDYTGLSFVETTKTLKITSEDFTENNVNDLNNCWLTLNYTETYQQDVNTDINISSSSEEDYETLSPTKEKLEFSFQNYVEKTISKSFPNENDFTQDGNVYSISRAEFIKSIGLTDVGESDIFAYGVSSDTYGNYTIVWDGTSFNITSGRVQILADGDLIKISDGNLINNLADLDTSKAEVYVQDKIRVDGDKYSGLLRETLTILDGFMTLKGEIQTSKGNFKLEYYDGQGYVAGYDTENGTFEIEESSDGVSIEELEINGVVVSGLRTALVTFEYEYSATISEDKVGNSGVMVKVSRGETIKEIRYYGGSLTSSYSSTLNVQAGDTISYSKVTNSYDRSEFKILDAGDSSPLTINTNISFGEDSEEDLKYIITKGTGNIYGSECEYVSTSKIYTITTKSEQTTYSYEYKIWGNGIIEVNFIKSVMEQGDVARSEEAYYVYLPNDIEAGSDSSNGYNLSWPGVSSAGFYKYEANTTTTDQGIVTAVQYEKYEAAGIGYMDEYQFNDDSYTFTVDLISVGFSSDGVLFARNNVSIDALPINFRGEVTEDKKVTDSTGLTVLIGNEGSKTISVSSFTAAVSNTSIDATISYKLDDSSNTVSDMSHTFTGVGEYKVSWAAKSTIQITKSADLDEGENHNTAAVLLASDIAMGDKTQSGGLEKNIIGSNYVIRFVSSGAAMFGSIDGAFIKNAYFAGENSGGVNGLFAGEIGTSSTTDGTTNTDKTEINSVALYGTIRNIASDSKKETGAIYADYDKIGDLTVGITNSISMIGLNNAKYEDDDIGEEEGFSFELAERETFQGKEILVAGDAVKGNNGNSYNVVNDAYSGSGEATVKTCSKTASSALSGDNGQDAEAACEATSEATSESILLSGKSGIGGYGGDGANGIFSEKGYAVGGGHGGKAGTSPNTKVVPQCGGNVGVGGFGRITKTAPNNDSDYCFTLYTSGNSGDSENIVSGSNGTKYTSSKINSAHYCAHFGSLISKFCNAGKSDYEDCGWFRTGHFETKNLGEKSDKTYSNIGGVTGGENAEGIGNTAKTIYFYRCVDVDGWIRWSLDQWKYYAWTSGETVNAAGQITFVNGG